MKTRKTKRRALYFYTCASCNEKRASLIYVRATGEVCAKCRKNQIPENQLSLFDREKNDQVVGEVLDLINKELTETRQQAKIEKKGRKPNKKQQ
jgi:hypothetical protein